VFYDLGVPVTSTRKVVGVPVSPDGSITVPVYTFRSPEPSRYRASDSPSECTLQPFFITLSKTEATDPVAVREAITRGYGRFIRPEMKSHLWVPQGHSRAASHLPVLQSEEKESVTEIHLEGEQTRVVEIPASQSSEGMDVDSSEASISLSVHGNDSTVSLGSVGSAKSGKLVPRGDLFKVHVADASTAESSGGLNMFKSKEPVIPLWKGNVSTAAGSWSILENRRKAKKNMLNRLTSGINSIVNPSYASDDDASPPATPSYPPLVVRPGEGIFCEWSVKRYNEFLDSAWDGGEEVTDPAIAKERAKKREGKAISIEDCLDEFSKEETLGQDDLWYCPQVCGMEYERGKRLIKLRSARSTRPLPRS
jgi:ubiquitin carboxyl-terminal hydrolase 4/11/15